MTEEKALWSESLFVLEAYKQGVSANIESLNPYEENTNSWYSWNRGYNTSIDKK